MKPSFVKPPQAPQPVWVFDVGRATATVEGGATDAWAKYGYPSVVYFWLKGPARDLDRAADKIRELGEVVDSRAHYMAIVGDLDELLDAFARMRGVRLAR